MMGNDEVIFKSENGLNYMQFKKLLELGVNHLYTLKSPGIDFVIGPLEERSYQTVADVLKIPREKIIVPKQAHTDCVKCVDERTMKDDLKFTDGIITDKKGLALAAKNADCILLNFYDPVKKVIANVHSGWRGTYKKIGEKAVIKMINNYGCNPKDIWCFINPSIRQDHFEVDEDVMELGKEIFSFTNRTDEFIQKGRIFEEKQKYNIDTVKINKILLENLGLLPEKIIDCEICSYCNHEKVSSARADGLGYMRAISILVM
ncbi:MAG: polyphenol oxidase family protein [Clostridia bacterium]|nr:polyphenol oxidase family protein [Clostridia bacterium]